jgi:F5/8 type C domain/Glycosyl hydrolases family 43
MRAHPHQASLLALAMALAAGCASPSDDSSTGQGGRAGGQAGGQATGQAGGKAGSQSGGPAGAPGSAGQAGSSLGGTPGGAGAPGGTGGTGLVGTAGAAGGRGGASAAGGNAGSAAGRGGGGATAGAAGSGRGGSAGAGSGGTSAADVLITIKNGGFWNDTSGKRIEAHGPGFIKVADTWYWIGEDKSHNSGNFKGVNAYASKDLSHWEFKNAIITKDTATDLAASGRIIERPKVIYNEATKQYVMWLHWDGNSYADAEAGVFSSPTVDGDYVLKSHFRPNKNMSRDDTLFKDDDGKAYFISAANENADLMLYELSDDYLTIKRQVMRLSTAKREAPAMFKQGGRYFIITSAATGWDPNQAQYFSATSIEGPWTSLTNIGNNNTYDTQSAYVLPVQGTQATTCIFVADRWQDPDLVGSKYIWLPIKISGASLSLDYYAEWQLNVTTGRWSVNDGFLPQSGWTLLSVDSEETQGEDGRATNAFDDSSSTIWHTKYTGTTDPHPHELQIDMGATYNLTGFRYLPRQDKDDHGMVAQYQFYASTDRTNWGTPVASGTFNSDRNEKRVMFPSKAARYIRFVALTEINGGDWTSVAELDAIGTAQ